MSGYFGMHLANIRKPDYRISKGCGVLIDQDKIILMTKLAVYEKEHIKEDRRRNSYYIEDYIYIKNFKTRFSVSIVVLLVVIFDAMRMINGNLVIPASLGEFINIYMKPYLMPWVIILIGYTILSTAIYRKRYVLSQKRLNSYNKLLKDLDDYDQDKANEERATYETE